MSSRPPSPSVCAQCGAAIPPRARSCPECGADERTGWAEQSVYDGLELPESEDEQAEKHASRKQRRGEISPFWMFVAFVLLALLIMGALALG